MASLRFPKPDRKTAPKHKKLVICGTFIDAPTPDAVRIREDTQIVVDLGTGRIEEIRSSGEWGEDDTSMLVEVPRGEVVIPGFIDCHIHAPQYTQLGTKTDIPLMEWLNNYTFPTESAFSSVSHAEKIYTRLIRRLLQNGTTTAVYFGSNHLAATKMLATLCATYGQRALVGKTCSDQFLPDYYVEGTKQSLEDTEEFVRWCFETFGKFGDGEREGEGALVGPVITPRFVPTCSLPLLHGLGALAQKHNVHIQTHAAESPDQVSLVASQHPTTPRDIQILASTNLLTPKTILAHCCHLATDEAKRLAEVGTAIASCPYSNMFFAGKVLPVEEFRGVGVKIGLGTDIAGGHKPGMVSAMNTAVLADRVLRFGNHGGERGGSGEVEEKKKERKKMEEAEKPVDWKYAFFLATKGGADALGIGTGVFEVGKKWDAVQISLAWEGEEIDDEEEEVGVRFEKWVCCFGGEREVRKVWVDGRVVLSPA